MAPALTNSLHFEVVLFQTRTRWPDLRSEDATAEPMAPRPMKPNRRPEGERRILEGEEMELEKYEMKGGGRGEEEIKGMKPNLTQALIVNAKSHQKETH